MATPTNGEIMAKDWEKYKETQGYYNLRHSLLGQLVVPGASPVDHIWRVEEYLYTAFMAGYFWNKEQQL